MPVKRSVPEDWNDPRWCVLGCPAIPRVTFGNAPIEQLWERIGDQGDQVGWGLERTVIPMANESAAIKVVRSVFGTPGTTLLWPTLSPWTAMFGQPLDFSAAKVPILRVAVTLDDGECANAEVTVQTAGWQVERMVQSARNDVGSWVHTAAGNPYPFEPENAANSPPARFGPAAAMGMAAQIGLRPNEISFFADHAWAVRREFAALPADPWRVAIGPHLISVGGDKVYPESAGAERLAEAIELLVNDAAYRRTFARGEATAGFGPRILSRCEFPGIDGGISSIVVLGAVKAARRQRGS